MNRRVYFVFLVSILVSLSFIAQNIHLPIDLKVHAALEEHQALVFVEPENAIYRTADMKVGDTIQINVTIANITGLVGFQFELRWNSSLLNGVSITENLFSTITPPGQEWNVWTLQKRITPGEACYAYTFNNLQAAIHGGYAPFNVTPAEGYSQGKLAAARITLEIMTAPPPPPNSYLSCALEIAVSKPGNKEGESIPHTVRHGNFQYRRTQAIDVSVLSPYETDSVATFFDFLVGEPRYPIDCLMEVNISGAAKIQQAYLKTTGDFSGILNMTRTSEEHFELELQAVSAFSNDEVRDALFLALGLLFEDVGFSLGSPPWNYSPPPDPTIQISELVIVYEGGGEFRKENPISPLYRVPTLKDTIHAMLPVWNSEPVGTIVITSGSVDFLLSDPLGRQVGSVYVNGFFDHEALEIDESFYSGRILSPEFLYIPNVAGEHRIQVFGVSDGEYNLKVLYQGSDAPTFDEYSDTIIEGAAHEYNIEVVPEFPSLLVLSLVLIATLFAAMASKRLRRAI